MFKVGDKARVKSTGGIGIVCDCCDGKEVCLEFDGCPGTQTHFPLNELELIRPGDDPTSDVDFVQSDKGL